MAAKKPAKTTKAKAGAKTPVKKPFTGASTEEVKERINSKDIMPVKIGHRPRVMTVELFKKICAELEESIEGLGTICATHGSSRSAFNDLRRDNDELTAIYARAKEEQADYFNELQREIAFNRTQDHTAFTGANVVNRDKLILDTLRWQQAKAKPRTYGDKLDLTSDNKPIQQVTVFQLPDNGRDPGKNT